MVASEKYFTCKQDVLIYVLHQCDKMNKKLCSDRTLLHYLSHMGFLALGQLLNPEIGKKGERHA